MPRGRALSSEALGPSEWSLRTAGPCALHLPGRNPWEGGPWLQDRTCVLAQRGSPCKGPLPGSAPSWTWGT